MVKLVIQSNIPYNDQILKNVTLSSFNIQNYLFDSLTQNNIIFANKVLGKKYKTNSPILVSSICSQLSLETKLRKIERNMKLKFGLSLLFLSEYFFFFKIYSLFESKSPPILTLKENIRFWWLSNLIEDISHCNT